MAWLRARLERAGESCRWLAETLWDAFFNAEPPRAPRQLREPTWRPEHASALQDRIHPASGKLIKSKALRKPESRKP